MPDHAVSTERSLTHRPVVGSARGLHVPGEVTDQLDGVEITALHPLGSDVWVLASRRDLYRCSGDGRELVASLDEGAGVCLTSHGGALWVGGDGAVLWRLDGASLRQVRSFEDAPSRDGWHTPWGGPPAVFSMASDGTDLYVSVHVGGILRTSDAGRTWTPTIDLHDDVHQVTVDAAGTVWAATGDRGLAHSSDRGATWRYHTSGLHAGYLLAVATTIDAVVVAASSGNAGRDGALYRFDGDRFERCRDGLPDAVDGAVGPRQLAALDDDVIVALPGGDVYASADGGRRWAQIAEHLPDVSEVSLMP